MSANTSSTSEVSQEDQAPTTIKLEEEGGEVEIIAQKQRDLQMRSQRNEPINVLLPNPSLERCKKAKEKVEFLASWTGVSGLEKAPLCQQLPFMTDERFQKKFRFSREHVFKILATALKEDMERNNSNYKPAISFTKRILIALYYLTASCTAKRVAYEFRATEETVALALEEFLDSVSFTLHQKVIDRNGINNEKNVVEDFSSMWQFPNTFGVLCRTHFPVAPITSPLVSPEKYLNVQGFHSYALIVLVDAKGRFFRACDGFKGNDDIESIFRSSITARCIINSLDVRANNFHVVSKEFGPMTVTTMKPYKPQLRMSPQKEHFNKRLLRAAFVADNALDRLRGRFKVLMKRPDVKMETFERIVLTCIALHNMCEEQGEKYWPSWNDAVSKHYKMFPQPLQVNNSVKGDRRALLDKRDALCQTLYDDNFTFESQ